MSATVMQTLDTTIANVALPHMQGNLSASIDQVNWILTSYMIGAAVATAPTGWLASRFGRKKLFMLCVLVFTFASVLCSFAQNIEQMVLFRFLQGLGGAALVPLSQAVMLDAYPSEERGHAMAVWSMGVMLGPIMGPTLGAWLTDNYSWHWIFLVNLPVGIATVVGFIVFMDETKVSEDSRFDWFGFVALSVGIAAVQLILDRGEQLGWFDSREIVMESCIAVAGFYFFFAHSTTTKTSFVRFEIFKDRNYVACGIFTVVSNVAVFATLALMTQFLQNVLGYPILMAGVLLAARGVGTFIALLGVSRLMKLMPPPYVMLIGLAINVVTIWHMSGFTDQTSGITIGLINLIQGIGVGLLFVPCTTIGFSTLPAHLRTEGTGILTLIRNVGSAVGISYVIAVLVSDTATSRAILAESLTPFSNALRLLDPAALSMSTDLGRASMEMIISQQASIIAYGSSFGVLMYFVLLTIPFLLLFESTPKNKTSLEEAVTIN